MLRTLFVNTSSNMSVLVVKLTITFIMTPILIHNLGNYDYGLWEMMVAVIGYMGILDLGIKPAVSRFASKLKAEDDQDGLLELFSAAVVYMVGVGILLLVIFMTWGLWFPASIAPEGASTEKYAILLMVLGAQLLIVFPGYVAESFLEGFQLYYVKNNITIVNSIIGVTIIYFNITPENALILLVSLNAIGLSVKYLLFFILLLRPRFGSIGFKLNLFSLARLLEVLVFGAKSLVQGVATRMEHATDALVIGTILGPAMVPLYSIPANLVRYISTIGMNLTHAFMPLFSDLNARQQHDKIVQIYIQASKLVIGVVAPLAGGISVVGAPFIGIWIGEEFRESAEWIILLLVIFITFPYLNPFYSRYLTALDKHLILAKLSPISAIINLALSVLLVREYGIIGAAIGSVVPVLIFTTIYLRYTCNSLDISVFYYIKHCIFPTVIPLATMVTLLVWFRSEYGIHNYVDIFYTVVLGATVYSILFWLITLNTIEKDFVKKKIRVLIK